MKITVTCDDYGESKEANERVIKAFREKLIDRASLMVNALRTDEAIKDARRDQVPIGLHFSLGDSVGQSIVRSFSRRHVESEIVRQMAAVRELQPLHFDSHFHVHLLPWVATVVGQKVPLPIRGGKVAIGPTKGSIISLFAQRFPTFDYLVDFDWFPRLSPGLIRSIFSQVPNKATVEVIVHPQKGKSLEWLLAHGTLNRHPHL